jgi:hypothetical protein
MLILSMAPPRKALDSLKNAFSKLKKSTEKRRKALLDCLAKKEKLSDADETWLDSDGNLVDEERVIEAQSLPCFVLMILYVQQKEQWKAVLMNLNKPVYFSMSIGCSLKIS